MELIDKQTAIRNYCMEQCGCKPDDCGLTLERDGTERCSVVEFLEKQPTIDAVPVVRCRDCEFYTADDRWCRRLGLVGAFDQNDYCSHAERRNDDERRSS